VTPIEELHLDHRLIGKRVLIYDRVDSTNTMALDLARDRANDGLVIQAYEQIAGRGRLGRRWDSPRGQGLLLSIVLFPPSNLRRAPMLTALAAVAVCETIREVSGLQAQIKWPNDVLINGSKVCGILIEQANGTVIGIGLNVNQDAAKLAETGLAGASSIAHFLGRSLELPAVLLALVRNLDREYDLLLTGDFASLESCWKWRTGLLGKEVLVQGLDCNFRGRLRDLTWDGAEIEIGHGESVNLLPETIQQMIRLGD
jgi:BirA family biotin operon repressor/biotin-[acetyl-CoA-carboxylase] ligase